MISVPSADEVFSTVELQSWRSKLSRLCVKPHPSAKALMSSLEATASSCILSLAPFLNRRL